MSIVAVLFCLLWIFISSETGTRIAVKYARTRLPDAVTIDEVRGRLKGPLTFINITYEDEAVSASIDTTVVDWNLFALLFKRIDLVDVQIAGVDVTLVAASQDQPPRPETTEIGSDQTFGIWLDQAVVRRLELVLPGTDSVYQIDSIEVGKTEFRDQLRVSNLELSSSFLQATLVLTVGPSEPYPTDASFSWSASKNGYALVGSGTARGTLESLTITHTLTAPVELNLAATVQDVLGNTTFGATLNTPGFDTGDIDSTLAPAHVAGELNLNGTPQRFTSDGTLQITEPSLGRIEAFLRATVEDSIVQLDTVGIRFPDRPGFVGLGGVLRRSDSAFAGEFGMVWNEIGWPLDGPAQLSSRGRGQLQFVGADLNFDIVTTLAGKNLPTGEIKVLGDGNQQRIRFSGSGNALGGSVTAAGQVTLEPSVSWRASITARQLDLTPLMKDSTYVSRQVALLGRTTCRVVADSFVGTVTLDSARATLDDIPIFVAGKGNFGPSAMALDSATASLLGGTFEVGGEITWAPRVTWDLSFNANDLEPGPLLPIPTDWPGQLSARGHTAGEMGTDVLQIAVRLDTLRGTLRGQTLGGGGSGSYRNNLLYVDRAALDWGSLRFNASGELGTDVSGRVELHAPDLSIAHPETAGSLTLEANFSGSRNSPRITADVTGDTLTFREMAAGGIRAAADLNFAPGGTFELELKGHGISTPDRALDSLTVDFDGTSEAHDFAVWVAANEHQVAAGGRGSLEAQTWRAGLTGLDVTGQSGEWELTSRAPLEVSRTSVVVGNFCLEGNGSLCASGTWQRNGPWGGTFQTTALNLADLSGLYASELEITGPIDVDGFVRADSAGTLDGRADIAMGPGELTYRVRGRARQLAFDRTTLNSRIGPTGAQTNWVTSLHAVGADSTLTRVDGFLALPDYRRLTDSLPTQRISGQINAVVDDFSAVEAFFPGIVNPAGILSFQFGVDGTLRRPRLLGNAQLSDLRVDVPELGLELREGSLVATGGENGITLVGRIRSGDGILDIEGSSSGQLAADTVLNLHLSGSNIQAAATTEVQMKASPDLLVSAGRSWVAVEGDVTIPWAVFELREIPATAIPVSGDLIYVGDTITVGPNDLNLHTRVRVVLGDSVSFKGFGFTVRPRGSLLVIDEPGRVTTGTGQLTLDGGRYRAYGQDLTIDYGRVIFAGSAIDNPALDVRAIRRARDSTIAGLAISGTLRQPEVTIFSDPVMLQSDAFSYLLIGRPLSEATASEGNRLSGAARSLGLRGGNFLAQRIGTRFGLDDLRIQADESWREASFLAGKYLSPRLYVAYSLGLFDSADLLRVRYLLSSKWTLQAETGEGTATDIFYRIERGR